MQMKMCYKCNTEKDISCFAKRKGKICQSQCKECNKQYRTDNNLKIKQYQEENKELIKISRKNSYLAKKEHYQQYNYLYRKNRKKNDPAYKLRFNVSNAIHIALRRSNSSKNGKSSVKYLSYSLYELRKHLENQFECWMNWNNHGLYNSKTWNDNDPSTWTRQIDHVIPQSDLPYVSMEDDNFKKCWALENLRPLSAKQNILDSNRKENVKQK